MNDELVVACHSPKFHIKVRSKSNHCQDKSIKKAEAGEREKSEKVILNLLAMAKAKA